MNNRLKPSSIQKVYCNVRAFRNHIFNLVDYPIVILVYHRVTDLQADPEMLAVSPGNFRQQIEYIKQHFSVLRFEEEWSNTRKSAVIITFDDGYADNANEALPVLEEFGLPATFFISTGSIGIYNEFWWHQLERILLRDGDFPPRFRLQDSRYSQSWNTASPNDRIILYHSLNKLMKKVSFVRRENWMDQLKSWAGPGNTDCIHRSMTEEELKRLAASPWATIGAHTVTHSTLSALSEEEQRQEIISSRHTLEKITGKQITTFSYPFGRKKDYNRTTIRLCREAGFIKAAANYPGQVHRWTDPFQLPRHLVRNWDLKTFVTKIEEFWTR
jgi:peptidoglycan/xylan/chitin deacetylase (PgdA/CDA1 family)